MFRLCALLVLLLPAASFAADTPFDKHGKLRVSKSGTHLEHADGTPFFFLADTCWTGPALSTAEDWDKYLADRRKKGFTAIQFNCISPWRTAPTDAAGRASYSIQDGKLVPNEEFFKQLDARWKAVNDAGLLAVPVLVWTHKKGDAGFDLSDEQIIQLVKFELNRYKSTHSLYVLAGDARYNATDAEKWKRIGRAAFAGRDGLLVTTHPTGMNFPWKAWENEKWLTVLGYQSGHGDDANTVKWIHSGPPAEYGKRESFTRPVINLEPPYEGHNGYQSRKPHSDYSVRRAVYWSLLAAPVAGVTYGGHGVWSWHTKPGEQPTDHAGTGVAKVWSEAIHLPGSAQMGHVQRLFESLPWTELRPAPDVVKQKSDDPMLFVSAAATKNHKTIVVYWPAKAKCGFNLAFNAENTTIAWFDPRTGESKEGGLTPPDEQDWVQVIQTK